MKEYIRDDGKIRSCSKNVARMNIFEFIIFDIKNGFFKTAILNTTEQYLDCFKIMLCAIFNTIGVVLFPISLIIKAMLSIKRAKADMKMWTK